MAATRLSFHDRLPGSVSDVLVRKTIMVVIVFHLIVGAVSSYRAWVQVRSVDLYVDSHVVRAGSTARADVVTSGRVTVDVRLELLQGARSEILGVQRVRSNGDGFYDPRTRKGSLSVALTPRQLAHFRSGPAILRATARGRPQWLREPPPKVKDVAVEVVN